jgi:hypothetical protein
MAATAIDPSNPKDEEAMRGLVELVYSELVKQDDSFPKRVEAATTLKQIRSAITDCEVTGVEPSHILSYLKNRGAVKHHHLEFVFPHYGIDSVVPTQNSRDPYGVSTAHVSGRPNWF